MSNHAGSYLLAEVLEILWERGVFTLLGTARSQEIVQEIVRRARHQYDCNASEILERIGPELGMCRSCQESGGPLERGLCANCRS